MQRKPFCENWTIETANLMEMMPSRDRKAVKIPHDAMFDMGRSGKASQTDSPAYKDECFRGYFQTGAYKYATSFFVPENWKQKSVYFEFEGVYRDANVLIDDDYAAHHSNGYTPFVVNADDFLRYGKTNTLSVIVKNGKDSRWYTGLGIYRPVNIMIGGLIHIMPDGIRIRTVSVDAFGASLAVSYTVRNRMPLRKTVVAETTIYDREGKAVSKDRTVITIMGGSETAHTQNIYLKEQQMWDEYNPYLYCAETVLYESDEIIDTARDTFGVRTMALDVHSGLRINGKQVKLRGGCIHGDNGLTGAAVYETTEYRRVKKLKEAGFNAIRMAHHPAGRALLKACDEIGMYIMNELSDIWARGKTIDDSSGVFEDSWKKDIDAMIAESYNHPSVIMYSIGNEIPDVGTPIGSQWGRKLAARVKAQDPSRYTINCINGLVGLTAMTDEPDPIRPEAVQEDAGIQGKGDINESMTDLVLMMEHIMQMPVIGTSTEESYSCVDIAGYNYMTGRYELDGQLYPNRIICGSETYSPEIGRIWKQVTTHSYLIGDFSWTAWEYLGEAGMAVIGYGNDVNPYKAYPCYMAYAGDFNLIGERKPISYYREIVYGLRKTPYIACQRPEHYHEQANRTPWAWSDSFSGWTWSGSESKAIIVEVYADAEEVVLILNGNEIGRKPCGKEQLFRTEFETVYEPGTLIAVAYAGGQELGRYTLQTASGEKSLCVRPEAEQISCKAGSLAYIGISLEDKNGNLFHEDDRIVSLNVEGCGILAGYGSGNPVTQEELTDKKHSLYEGRLGAVIRPDTAGTITVTAVAEGGLQASIQIEVIDEI